MRLQTACPRLVRGSLDVQHDRRRAMSTFRAMMIAALAFAAGAPAALRAELPSKSVLTLEAAQRIAAAAHAEAIKRGATVVIVVVDDGGHVVYLERLNDTQVASVDVGVGK